MILRKASSSSCAAVLLGGVALLPRTSSAQSPSPPSAEPPPASEGLAVPPDPSEPHPSEAVSPEATEEAQHGGAPDVPTESTRAIPIETVPVASDPIAPRSTDPNQELTIQDRSGEASQMRERPTQVTLSYSAALALGETRNFVGDFSFLGFGLDWHRRFGERFSAGVSLGWQVLADKTRGTTDINELTVTGVQVRHLNTFPVLLSARALSRGQRRAVSPYVGLGVGVYPSEWRADIGLLSLSSFTVHFGVAPEIGIQIPTRSIGRLCLGVKYDYAFESGGNPEISYFAFTVGLAR